MNSRSFRGIGVCAGIASGHVHVVDRRRVSVPRYRLARERLGAEQQRFENAIVTSEAQLDELRQRARAENAVPEIDLLLQAHALMLRDPVFYDDTVRAIWEQEINAEWAVKASVKKVREVFDRLDDSYFRERRNDVDVVGDRVLRNLIGAETELLGNLTEDAIVVAYELSPADTVALGRYRTRAFVTEVGGRTSHIAIVAKAMNVPAVVGVRGLMEVAGFGDSILVDGSSGEVILEPTEAVTHRFEALRARRAREEEALRKDRALPAVTTDGFEVRLLGNIEVPDEIDSVLAHGGRGIGLYRTEFLAIERHKLPSAEEHALAYKRVVERIEPVTIRTIDIGGDKFLRANGESRVSPGANPALGLRAIRFSLREPETFRDQLRGVLEASAFGKVRLLFPLVTSVDEVRRALELLEHEREGLRARDTPFDEALEVGVMIETPAAVTIADLLAEEVDFFSIGTNDLIQYSLAVDRGNDDVAYLYRPCEPSVLRMIDRVVEVAAARGVDVTLCGEMASDPFHAPLLLGLGVSSLSMNAQAIPVVKRLIRRLSRSDCQRLAKGALELATASEVERQVADHLRSAAPELFG